MPFKSRSQEDLFAGASGTTSATAATSGGNSTAGTSRDDHSVAMTMTSLLLLRPDGSATAVIYAYMRE